MAISDFSNFAFLTPKIKKTLLGENISKIQNFGKISKTGKYVRELPLSSHHAKFQINIFNFDPQMAVIYVKSDDVIF